MSGSRGVNPNTMGLNRTGLILGTTSTYTTTVTVQGVINSKHVTGLTAQTNTATPITDAVTGVSFVAMIDDRATVLVFGQTLAGAIQMAQGSVVATVIGVTTTAGAFISAPQFPLIPDDFMVLGYCLVRTAPSAADFTAGTSSWTATGITTSQIIQCAALPNRPQTS